MDAHPRDSDPTEEARMPGSSNDVAELVVGGPLPPAGTSVDGGLS